MFEESVSSIPSIWASMNSWFTPFVLFVFLNLTIGTIYFTSNLATPTQKPNEHQKQSYPQLARSPSVLQRIKSINFYSDRSQDPITISEKTTETDTHFSFQQAHEQEQPQSPYFSGSPSLLQRIKSVNLYSYLAQEPTSPVTTTTTVTVTATATATNTLHSTRETETPYTSQPTHEQVQEHPQPEEEEDNDEEEEQIQDQEQTLDDIYRQIKDSHFGRTKSDTEPASGEIPKKLASKMMKSASSKSAFGHFEEEDIVESRRPATMKERKVSVADVADDEVDARADDFIYKFKQQLKLQRMDSIVKYTRR